MIMISIRLNTMRESPTPTQDSAVGFTVIIWLATTA